MTMKVRDVEALGATLKELPAVDQGERELTKMEAVKLLAPRIRELRKKGYSMERIAEKLTEGGFAINSSTLASYLARTGGGRGRSKRGKKEGGGKVPAAKKAGDGGSESTPNGEAGRGA